MFVHRSGPVLAALLLAAAGCKDVSQRNQSRIVIATFSSPNIPTPNDLALQAVPTISSQTQAFKDLLQSFVDEGGFPADQAPTLTVPLQAYDWESASHTYSGGPSSPAWATQCNPEACAKANTELNMDGG